MEKTGRQISIIVAIAENYAIGLNNQLLWHIPDDLKRFKRLTSDHTVVMGKRTYESLPKRPLPNRQNLVITDIAGEQIDGCTMAYSIEDAVRKMDDTSENFVIGGGSVYRQFLPLADRLYITWVHRSFTADTFFPEINMDEWRLVSEEKIPEGGDNGFGYSYCIYERK